MILSSVMAELVPAPVRLAVLTMAVRAVSAAAAGPGLPEQAVSAVAVAALPAAASPVARVVLAAERRPTRALHKGHQMSSTSSTFGRCKLAVATMFMLGMLTSGSHAYTLEQQEMCSGDAMRLCS
jgi:hypothetical protein